MWLSSSGTFTLIEFIPYSLWVGLGRSYTHCYQLVFTPYFTETWENSKWARWSPACVSVLSSECLIESMKRKCGNISLLKRQGFFSVPVKCYERNLYIMRHFFPAKSVHDGESSSSPTSKDSSIFTTSHSLPPSTTDRNYRDASQPFWWEIISMHISIEYETRKHREGDFGQQLGWFPGRCIKLTQALLYTILNFHSLPME